MDYKVNKSGGRALSVRKSELRCFYCGREKSDDWYFHLELRRLMCGRCVVRIPSKLISTQNENTMELIDEVIETEK